MTKHNVRVLSSGFGVDVRLRQIRGRWIASAFGGLWLIP